MEGLSQLETRRFSVDEVMRMVEVGILSDDDRLELLDGALIVKEPQSPWHAEVSALVARRLREAHGPGAYPRAHSPIVAGERNLPEPDVALLRGEEGCYLNAHPTGRDVLLVVEVAVSTHALDERKARIYAEAGVPVYWLLDLPGARLELRTEPGPGGYGRCVVLERGDHVRVPGTTVDVPVADLLP